MFREFLSIINKERLMRVFDEKIPNKMVFIDIANPRDIEDDVKEIGIDLFNIDDLRGIAEKNKKLREKEVIEAEKIIKNQTRHEKRGKQTCKDTDRKGNGKSLDGTGTY